MIIMLNFIIAKSNTIMWIMRSNGPNTGGEKRLIQLQYEL
jgi:hypothetical protein